MNRVEEQITDVEKVTMNTQEKKKNNQLKKKWEMEKSNTIQHKGNQVLWNKGPKSDAQNILTSSGLLWKEGRFEPADKNSFSF